MLAASTDAWARDLAELFKLFQAGRATVEDVIRQADRAREALGEHAADSIDGTLAEGLATLLRRGEGDFT